MLAGTELQMLAPWYLIDFWHREKENFGMYRFFVVEDRVRRLCPLPLATLLTTSTFY